VSLASKGYKGEKANSKQDETRGIPKQDSTRDLFVKVMSREIEVSNQITAGPIQAGSKVLLSVIPKLINSMLNKEELPDWWRESIIVPVKK
jgi:hypothetical protein